MNDSFNLNFCFKGNRKYVHGTDIFTKISSYYSDNAKRIDITFHGSTFKNMTFMEAKPKKREIKVKFKCLLNNDRVQLFGVENNKIITCSYEYFEAEIVENTTVNISQESIKTTTIYIKYSFIEYIVAMNKVLLETLYKDIQGKWYFTRLQLKEVINIIDIASIQLKLKSNFQFKLTKSIIIVNGIEIGFLYFSLIPKES